MLCIFFFSRHQQMLKRRLFLNTNHDNTHTHTFTHKSSIGTNSQIVFSYTSTEKVRIHLNKYQILKVAPTKDCFLDQSSVSLLWTLFPMKPWLLGFCVHLCITQFYQESCQVSLDRIPLYPWCFLWVIFHPLTRTLLLGYKSPLAHAIFEPEAS